MAKDNKNSKLDLPFKKETKGTFVFGNDDGETVYVRKSRVEGDKPEKVTITW